MESNFLQTDNRIFKYRENISESAQGFLAALAPQWTEECVSIIAPRTFVLACKAMAKPLTPGAP
jgi:hypothetical protein